MSGAEINIIKLSTESGLDRYIYFFKVGTFIEQPDYRDQDIILVSADIKITENRVCFLDGVVGMKLGAASLSCQHGRNNQETSHERRLKRQVRFQI